MSNEDTEATLAILRRTVSKHCPGVSVQYSIDAGWTVETGNLTIPSESEMAALGCAISWTLDQTSEAK